MYVMNDKLNAYRTSSEKEATVTDTGQWVEDARIRWLKQVTDLTLEGK